MPWFAAHAVLYVRFKSGAQTSFPVWENIYLVEAANGDAALTLAEGIGRLAAGDSGGSFTWDEQPAEWVYAGIRKIISVAHAGLHPVPASGDELSYSEFVLADLASVEKLANGEQVKLEYVR